MWNSNGILHGRVVVYITLTDDVLIEVVHMIVVPAIWCIIFATLLHFYLIVITNIITVIYVLFSVGLNYQHV